MTADRRPLLDRLRRLARLGLGGAALAAVGACAGAPADKGLSDDDPADDGGSAAEPPAPLACPTSALPPQQLRLLTRVEYQNTVADLFSALSEGAAAGAACEDDGDCDLAVEVCEAGACAELPCDQRGFALAGSYSAVVLAGSMNGWAATEAAGASPLRFDGALGLWRGVFTLPEGTHSYKFVADGAWLADPSNPLREPDGFGGENSVLVVDCSAEGGTGDGWRAVDPVADFPVESRPQGYPFDNSAEAGLVTATHLERYMGAAATLAAALVEGQAALLPCPLSEAGCPARAIEAVGPLALRRPLSDEERVRYGALIDAGGGGAAGFERAARVMFASTGFLYRSELGVDRGDGVYALDDHELASALSYTLTASMPDAALRAAAAEGALREPDRLAAEAERLLATPRAAAQLARVADQWLGTERLATADRQPELYPGFDGAVRAALAVEAGQTYAALLAEGADLRAFLVGGRAYLSPATAAIYGIAAPATPGLVALPDDRGGLLGLASVLASGAHSDQTSPVRRGLFVRERLLCQHLGAPPANAGGVPDVDPDATTRERFSQHSDDPTCFACHQHIDPVGFGLEDYDAIGAWRSLDAGQPIDSSGAVSDLEGFGAGTSAPFSGPAALGALLADSAAAPRCLAEHSLSYTTGRAAEAETDCVIDDLHTVFDEQGQALPAMWRAVVRSEAFRFRRSEGAE